MAVRAPSTERTCLALALVGLLVGLIPTPASSQEETVPPPDAESDAPDVRTTLPQVDAPVAGEPQRFLRAASGDGVLLQRAGDVLDVESGSVVASAMEKDEAFVVRDSWQGKGIGSELLNYLTLLAVKQGLQGFTAEVFAENKAMLHLFEKMNFDMKKSVESGTYELDMKFRGKL